MKNEFQLPGYEDLELSTQLVIREALARNIEVEVLDRSENFIRIRSGEKVEYIKQASKCATDSYITFLIMENKAVTKIILDEHGIRVPQGGQYDNAEAAFEALRAFDFSRTAIKPKTTNFGIGISFVDRKDDDAKVRAAIDEAFSHDKSILVEEFITGTEYRFLTIGDQTIGVTLRVPANVVGDGVHSIQELVEIKNQDPRRGENYRKPLEKIRLDQTELGILQEQHLSPESIPDANQQIFLRHNSNMSTGGDTIDFTDQIHEGYKALAVEAAKAVDATICGVDILVDDYTQAPTKNNYGIVELNFNPILLIHDYPYEGENRRSGAALLDFLGFKA
jgi:glutamate--cysteine ligase